MKLIFASNNSHKIEEIQNLLSNEIEIISMRESGVVEDIEENGSTLEENALIKARYIHQKLNANCFSDDSGLEVYSLQNQPGVYSARYAGEPKNDENNIQKLLHHLDGNPNRDAQFRTVIALILNNSEYVFEGIIKGKITNEKRGINGFGYDPVFIPEGYTKTFAEMTAQEKNKISHRAIATQKLVDFLESKN